MKITFYYDNGKTYTARRVTSYDVEEDSIFYEKEMLDRKYLHTSLMCEVKTEVLLGFKVTEGDRTIIHTLSPRAVVKANVGTKRLKHGS